MLGTFFEESITLFSCFYKVPVTKKIGLQVLTESILKSFALETD